MSISVASLTVGQEVALARSGSWDLHYQGVYTVTKANKIKVVLTRKGDGYERTFSVKRNCELPKTEGGYVERYVHITTVEDMEQFNARRAEEQRMNGLWSDLKEAATRKNLFAAQTVLALIAEGTANE